MKGASSYFHAPLLNPYPRGDHCWRDRNHGIEPLHLYSDIKIIHREQSSMRWPGAKCSLSGYRFRAL